MANESVELLDLEMGSSGLELGDVSYGATAPHLGLAHPASLGTIRGPGQPPPMSLADLPHWSAQRVCAPNAALPSEPQFRPRSLALPAHQGPGLAPPPTPWGPPWGGWRDRVVDVSTSLSPSPRPKDTPRSLA